MEFITYCLPNVPSVLIDTLNIFAAYILPAFVSSMDCQIKDEHFIGTSCIQDDRKKDLHTYKDATLTMQNSFFFIKDEA